MCVNYTFDIHISIWSHVFLQKDTHVVCVTSSALIMKLMLI